MNFVLVGGRHFRIFFMELAPERFTTSYSDSLKVGFHLLKDIIWNK